MGGERGEAMMVTTERELRLHVSLASELGRGLLAGQALSDWLQRSQPSLAASKIRRTMAVWLRTSKAQWV